MAKTPEKTENENAAKEQRIIPFANEQEVKIEALSASERLNMFIQNNRKIICIITISVAVLLIGFIVSLSVADALQTKALTQVEDLKRRYDDFGINLTEPSKEAEVTAFIDELSAFASKHSGYAGARGYSIAASIYVERKEWEAAEKNWIAAAKAGEKTYMAPIFLYNAAVAAEEQNNIQGAIDLYAQCIALADSFPAASRAQFHIGRLEETRNNKEAALQAYRDIINKWPEDSLWTNLAQSKIIALTLP
ncbi:MAG: tetratricopeptide repeat protein [Treponema sp.]|jgi:tetratricopeptide (TPR) repeat protein|nr:tetratricopeptide repeat protein [Treponema sp.]